MIRNEWKTTPEEHVIVCLWIREIGVKPCRLQKHDDGLHLASRAASSGVPKTGRSDAVLKGGPVVTVALIAISSLLYVVPPAHAACTVSGSTVDCSGDESAGFLIESRDYDPDVTTLNVNGLTTTIGGVGITLDGDGKKGDEGESKIGKGDNGKEGEAGLDLEVDYQDGNWGISTSADNAEGIAVTAKGGDGGKGGTGKDDVVDPFSTEGGKGGQGGAGGDIVVTSDAEIDTSGNISHGIVAVSDGGDGGDGGHAEGAVHSKGGDGGSGNVAGTITISNNGTTITTSGSQSQGIYAQSLGGAGGNGGSADGLSGGGGGGAKGGLAAAIDITNNGSIETSGSGAGGILAQSVGGFAGDGGGGFELFSFGASEQSGGDASTVTVNNNGAITTHSTYATAIMAQSTGGGGGSANTDGGIVSLGGSGSAGGNADTVTVDNIATLITQDDSSSGIQAQSIGGGGGDAGLSLGLVSIGAGGGSGGSGGEVFVANSGAISTVGDSSDALFAQSGGGGGGHGGSTGGIIAAIGGSGGSGGNGSSVQVTNSNDISTGGDHSNGIFAQSYGGGGGKGGNSVDVGAFVSIGVGGKGDNGGNGGAVQVNPLANASSTSVAVQTTGDHSGGVFAQSLGGGGGKGGWTVSVSGGYIADASIGIGGGAGGGGNGSSVDLQFNGTVSTQGDHSDGILAQSAGGGGGLGGFDITFGGSSTGALSVGVGGGGGSGGAAGAATLTSWADVTTQGDHSSGIVAESVGGGGGHGGFSISVAASENASFAVGVGGSGGSGGSSDSASLTSIGNVTTGGDHSTAVFAQSVGGGGGNGGFSIGLAASENFNVTASVGGGSGSGDNAGSVTVDSTGTLQTSGSHSSGFIAQSVGGGGGNGGFSISLTGSASDSADISVSVGGGGSSGGKGGAVIANNNGNITTVGSHSTGLLAQSQGGGGGNGGFSISGTLALGDGAGIPVSVGGGAGSGESAAGVTVTSVGTISTSGALAGGILAQSVGGGGNGGFSVAAGVVTGGDGGNISVSVGGSGGTGASAGIVQLTNSGDVYTVGDNAAGVIGQSIGGGGGNGGFSAGFDVAKSTNLAVTVGGSGGDGNDGASVTVANNGDVQTQGSQSYGVQAQSVGGGGGNGGFSLSGDFSKGSNIAVTIGGSGSGGGDGGAVDLTQIGSVVTTGDGAHAVMAQSVGKGGGAGGFAGSVEVSLDDGGNVGVTVGGGAGDGGTADAVTVVSSSGLISTTGKSATGIYALSQGGGGGEGGFAFTGNLGTGEKTVNIGVTVGGGGGDGGTSSDVGISNASGVSTTGDYSHAIQAQSIGGSGGSGGMAISANLSLNTSATGSGNLGVSVGGGGGSGNTSGAVTIAANDGDLTTSGYKSAGIYAKSIGGGGGDGGLSFSGDISGSNSAQHINVSVGGAGGSGNDAGLVTVTNNGIIETSGHYSEGIFAHSVGGGGGTGGLSAVAALSREGEGTNLSVGVAIGGSGGAAGDGEAVDVTNNGSINTHGVASTGIEIQSIGGGGGKGGSSFSGIAGLSQSGEADKRTLNIEVAVGGAGGSAGDANSATVSNSGSIHTRDGNAKGISAQSIGGGGGAGGAADAFSMLVGRCAVCGQTAPDSGDKSLTLNVSVGGAGGGGGDASTVSITNAGNIITEGAAADGIYAHSIGGGGGDGGNGAIGTVPLIGLTGVIIADGIIIMNPANALKVWTNVSVAIGGAEGTQGDGGKVVVDNSGDILTIGDQAFGIYTQSIGGGGGRGGATSGTAFSILALGAKGASGGNADTVTITHSGDILTTGSSAMGIFAQSIGGGGGHGGDISQNLFWPGVNIGIGVDLALGGGTGGNGADVSVTSNGLIATTGAGATGIFAQSVGGGGGVAGSAGYSVGTFFSGTNGDSGDAGTVTVEHDGNIYTTGAGAAGIFAQSGSGTEDTDTGDDIAQGATGTGKAVAVTAHGRVDTSGENSSGIIAQSIGVNNNSAITVTLTDDAIVVGGLDTDGTGTDSNPIGIRLLDGADNVVNNSGIVTTQQNYLGTAILTETTTANSTTINDTLYNYGTVTGSIYLAGVTNVLTNYDGGTLNMGSDINIGAGNTLTNYGVVSPGNKDQIYTTTLTGNYLQDGTGTYEVDVDFQVADANPGPGVPGEADLFHITGDADLDGLVVVNSVNGAYVEPDVTGKVLIMTTAGDHGSPTLVAADTEVVNYEITYDTTTTDNVYLEWLVNFAPDGLNRNETAAANYITAAIAAGNSDGITPIINALLEAPDLSTLRNEYDQLTPEPYIDNELASVLSNQEFARSMLNCQNPDEAQREKGCRWFKAGGHQLTRDESFEYLGFVEQAINIQAGMGGAFGDNQGASVGISYDRSQIDTQDHASSDGHRLQGGLALSSFNDGVSFEIAAVGGAAIYDVERYLTLTDTPMTAEGRQKMYFGGGQVRLAHQAKMGAMSIGPMVEAWGGYFRNDSLSESGAEGASLDVESRDEYFAAVRPALTLATESSTQSGVKVRAFVQGGMTYFITGTEDNGTSLTATMQGEGQEVPGFTVTSSLAEIYYDGAVGLDLVGPGGSAFRISGAAQYAEKFLTYGGDVNLVVPF